MSTGMRIDEEEWETIKRSLKIVLIVIIIILMLLFVIREVIFS
jgi:hypothetical protein